MKKIEINFNSLKSLLAKGLKNLSWVFFGFFIILAIMEILEIKQSAQIILESNRPPAAVNAPKGVRIDFKAYDKVVQRIESGNNYKPEAGTGKDPFNPGAAPAPAQPGSGATGQFNDSSGVLQLP